MRLAQALTTISLLLVGAGTGVVTVAEDVYAVARKLPVLHNVGIIPVQWQSSATVEEADLDESMRHLQVAVSDTVRKSGRFQVLDDDLIAELWEKSQGRRELSREYELNAYINLAVSDRGDTIVLFARVLGPNLEGYLQESTTLVKRQFRSASFDKIESAVSDLFFRLFNRLPVDVTVTSIQGKYITLSGGLSRGIHSGDTLKIVRPKISARHPATKHWLGFKTTPVGEIRIIESKKTAAVALLTKQIYEGSIEVGDGARVKAIPNRSRFQRLTEKRRFSQVGDTIIVPPLYGNPEDEETPQEGDVEALKGRDKKPGVKPKKATKGAPEPDKDGLFDFSSPFAFPDVTEVVSKVADRVTVHAGQQFWWYNGPGSTGSQFVWYLPLNTVGARVIREIMPNIKYGLGGGLGLGQSKNSNTFFAYDTHARIFWEGAFPVTNDLIDRYQAGGHASFSGLSLSGEKFGGGDWLKLGFFGALSGKAAISKKAVDWFGELSITPMTFGTIGYAGKKRTISTSLGWKMEMGAYLTEEPQAFEWGAGFEYSGLNLQDNANKSLGMSTFGINGLARYRF